MSLFRLIYGSKAIESLHLEDVIAIRERARERNEALLVTGFLVCGFGRFLQVLEGERTVVSEIFQRISRDPRHAEIDLVQFDAIPMRDFPDWGMNLLAIGEHNRREVEALLESLGCPIDLDTRRMTPEECARFLRIVAAKNRELRGDLTSA